MAIGRRWFAWGAGTAIVVGWTQAIRCASWREQVKNVMVGVRFDWTDPPDLTLSKNLLR